MSVDTQISSLSMPLPEDILKRKWSGDLQGALNAIAIRLENPHLPSMLRDRLLTERERIRRLPTQYPWTKAQALEKLREVAPGVTEAEFDRTEAEGRIDFIWINGEKRYFCRFHRTLIKYPEFYMRAGKMPSPVSKFLDPMIAELKEKGSLTRHIEMEASVLLDEHSFVPGVYRCWIPVPAKAAQQTNIHIEGDFDSLSGELSEARTAYWERKLNTWENFRVRYSYDSTIRYADPRFAPAPSAPLYPDALPVEERDLAEEGAYIRFTPYLRALAAELTEGVDMPVEKAWRFYEFVTKQVQYSYMRDYFQVDDLGEYCAVNLRGDCGLQALLFINLCRIAGIPARWQSGLEMENESAGSHDWAQFYLDGWGWLFADPSYGGSAWRNGSAERHAFYFGNIDPCRMAANRIYQAPLTPESRQLRVDPYDNQCGELERVGAEQPFTGRDLDDERRVLVMR